MYTVLKWLLGEPRAGETAIAINNWHQSNSSAVIEVSLRQYVDERIHSDERNNLQKLAFDHHILRSRCQHHFIILKQEDFPCILISDLLAFNFITPANVV